MTKEERLAFCTRCTNRKFSREKGLVCSLTGEIAAFEGTCPDYTHDAEMEKRQEERKKEAESRNEGSVGSLNSSAGILWGVVLIVVAVIWFVGGYIAGYIFFYPPFLLVAGIISVYRGVQKQKQRLEEKRRSKIDVLDNFK